MDLKNNLEIINFLKSGSNVYQETGGEIIIHCPYCDDALRPNAKSHGHLYISTNSPVFHCFRCETSGHLGTLLRDLGFSNLDVLKELGSSKFLRIQEKSVIQKKKTDVRKLVESKNKNFFSGDSNNYLTFEKYIHGRLGVCDINKYLITPEIINKKLCASFYNQIGNFVTARILNPTANFRYIRNKDVSEDYYFQEMDFDRYTEIVITEGVFDAIKLYRFSGIFPKDRTFYLSILGKNYGKAVNYLISNHLMFGKYKINLVFDNDNKWMKGAVCTCRKISKRLNSAVEIYGYHPNFGNDACECPFLEEV